jgi:hypothetical protein
MPTVALPLNHYCGDTMGQISFTPIFPACLKLQPRNYAFAANIEIDYITLRSFHRIHKERPVISSEDLLECFWN